jgi:hypothetical protein
LRKVTYILLIIILTGACAVSRRQKRENNASSNTQFDLFESIVNQNLTNRSFFIERAEFKIRNEEGEKSGIGTIKFLMPDKFLISIKSHTGIEVARIFLNGDSIMINDRIDKKLFYGSTSYLKSKYGLTTAILPVVLGDYVNDYKLDSTRINCIEGKLDIDGIVKNVKVNYQIDCNYGKSLLTIPDDSANVNGLQIRYSEFFKINGLSTPGRIEISDKLDNTVIQIMIEKIIIPWEGSIEFIPGKLYEKIPLL